jgi:hypothetical protein
MSADQLFELLFETQAFRVVLLAVSPLFPSAIDWPVCNLQLSTPIRLLRSEKRYFGATKPGLMGIVIQRPMLSVQLVKNGTLLILLSAFNDVRIGCFGAVFIAMSKGLVSFGRKIRILFLQRAIKQRSFQLVMAGFDLLRIKAINWYVCRIQYLPTLQRVQLKIFKREKLTVFSGLHTYPISIQLRRFRIG